MNRVPVLQHGPHQQFAASREVASQLEPQPSRRSGLDDDPELEGRTLCRVRECRAMGATRATAARRSLPQTRRGSAQNDALRECIEWDDPTDSLRRTEHSRRKSRGGPVNRRTDWR